MDESLTWMEIQIARAPESNYPHTQKGSMTEQSFTFGFASTNMRLSTKL